MLFCFCKKRDYYFPSFLFIKTSLKNAVERAFYETTIGAKWNVCEMELYSFLLAYKF